jgi:hypothetical protein
LVEVEVMPIEYVPSPLKVAGARVTSTQVFAVTAPTVPSEAPSAGLLFQVIPVSVQLAVIAKTWPPIGLASVTYSRSFAAVAGPPSPLTV